MSRSRKANVCKFVATHETFDLVVKSCCVREGRPVTFGIRDAGVLVVRDAGILVIRDAGVVNCIVRPDLVRCWDGEADNVVTRFPIQWIII